LAVRIIGVFERLNGGAWALTLFLAEPVYLLFSRPDRDGIRRDRNVTPEAARREITAATTGARKKPGRNGQAFTSVLIQPEPRFSARPG
jgi:hypothetical protein